MIQDLPWNLIEWFYEKKIQLFFRVRDRKKIQDFFSDRNNVYLGQKFPRSDFINLVSYACISDFTIYIKRKILFLNIYSILQQFSLHKFSCFTCFFKESPLSINTHNFPIIKTILFIINLSRVYNNSHFFDWK